MIDQLKDIDLNDYEREIAEEIIWNTNEKGYLDTDLILIADRFELLEEEIEPLLHKIQRLDPKGIGSRSLHECLNPLLQELLVHIESWLYSVVLFAIVSHFLQ